MANNSYKYFINLCTVCPDREKSYMLLPEDVKRLIWRLLHLKPYIECIVCNQVILRLEYDIREDLNTETIVNLNGYSKCVSC